MPGNSAANYNALLRPGHTAHTRKRQKKLLQ